LLLFTPLSLTYNKCAFNPLSVFMCFVWFSPWRATFPTQH
jgi:hypothetical protein